MLSANWRISCSNAFIVFFLQVGDATTPTQTQCFCNHLTWLSSFYVAPRPLDLKAEIAKLKNLDEYPALLSTFCVIIGTSLICMIWARRKDISDTDVVSFFTVQRRITDISIR